MLLNHLRNRNYDPSLYVNQVLDLNKDILTVYLTNLSGQIVGYQQYNPKSNDKKTNDREKARYHTYATPNTLAVWGLENLDPSKHDLYVVEGIFKASALHLAGFNALAVLTNAPKGLMSWLRTLPYNIIPIGDNDKAGERLVQIVNEEVGFCHECDLDECETTALKYAVIRQKRDSNIRRFKLPERFQVKMTDQVIQFLYETKISGWGIAEMQQIQSHSNQDLYFAYPHDYFDDRALDENGVLLTLDQITGAS